MKRMSIYRILAILFTASVFFTACTKDLSDVRLDPKISTSQILNLRSDSATVVGFVVAAGSGFTEKGVCYSTTDTLPTIAATKVVYAGDNKTATFNVVLAGLNYATKYYARAYATNASSTLYGEKVIFTTRPIKPQLTTAAITAITGNSATGGGSVTVIGGAPVSDCGICFDTIHNPTVDSKKTVDPFGTGSFVSLMTALKGNKVYYVRAYAKNSEGVGYGPEVTFKTLVDFPAVTTTAVTGVTKVAAVSGGSVTYDGGAPVTSRGLAWGTTANPTVGGTVIAGGSGLGTFVSNLTGLTTFTVYHVRAYATNSKGTAYGDDLTFTTLADTRTWYIPGDYVAASYPGTTFANWDPANSPIVKSTVSAPDKLEGYVYMSAATNNWKFATQPNWGGPNYGDGGAGILDPNGGNIASPAGYYKLNADAAALTYTAVATNWGVIGDATPNAWNDETALSYNPSGSIWSGGITLTSGGSFKFRANHSWDYNYGSTAANSTLDAGGSNIANTTAGLYFFILDLSHPNEYTYSANRWGIIGDATAGQWSSDQKMTWDAGNKCLTATLDLTVGSMKFRANDGWDINFGGDPTALTPGGANIPVAVAGNYTIKLFITGTSTAHCTINKNKK